MRHFYFRLVIGIVWLAAAIVSGVSANIPFAVFDAALGVVFLLSAYSIWKKKKVIGGNAMDNYILESDL